MTLSAENISKRYQTRGGILALDSLTLSIAPGEFVVLRGPSGCGKTTLLMLLGGMLHPSDGHVMLDGKDVYAMSQRQRALFRRQHIGFVFQMFHLVPYLNALQNVQLACGSLSASRNMLTHLGLDTRIKHLPAELSTGERQRVAIARALVNKPRVVLADEPTGNLDPENAARVLSDLHAYTKEGGTVVLATHGGLDESLVNRTVLLKEGKAVEGTKA